MSFRKPGWPGTFCKSQSERNGETQAYRLWSDHQHGFAHGKHAKESCDVNQCCLFNSPQKFQKIWGGERSSKFFSIWPTYQNHNTHTPLPQVVAKQQGHDRGNTLRNVVGKCLSTNPEEEATLQSTPLKVLNPTNNIEGTLAKRMTKHSQMERICFWWGPVSQWRHAATGFFPKNITKRDRWDCVS